MTVRVFADLLPLGAFTMRLSVILAQGVGVFVVVFAAYTTREAVAVATVGTVFGVFCGLAFATADTNVGRMVAKREGLLVEKGRGAVELIGWQSIGAVELWQSGGYSLVHIHVVDERQSRILVAAQRQFEARRGSDGRAFVSRCAQEVFRGVERRATVVSFFRSSVRRLVLGRMVRNLVLVAVGVLVVRGSFMCAVLGGVAFSTVASVFGNLFMHVFSSSYQRRGDQWLVSTRGHERPIGRVPCGLRTWLCE